MTQVEAKRHVLAVEKQQQNELDIARLADEEPYEFIADLQLFLAVFAGYFVANFVCKRFKVHFDDGYKASKHN